jgi:hypothetical protein
MPVAVQPARGLSEESVEVLKKGVAYLRTYSRLEDEKRDAEKWNIAIRELEEMSK